MNPSVEESLKQLTTLHAELVELRCAIPDLLRPLGHCDTNESASQFATKFNEAARKAKKDVQSFQKSMQGLQDVIEAAEKSRQENGEGITRYVADSSQSADQDGEEKGLSVDTDTPGNWIDELDIDMEQAPGIQIEKRATGMKIMLVKPSNLVFEVQREPPPPTIVCKGDSKIAHGITGAVLSQQRGKSMRSLLSMLASYRDIHSRPCVKCKQILSTSLDFPYLRRHAGGEWKAFHESCV